MNNYNNPRKKYSLASEKIKRLQGDSEWTVLQKIALDVEAGFKIQQKKLSADKLRTLVSEEIKLRYSEQKDIKDELLYLVPTTAIFVRWRNLKNWDVAIWSNIKDTGLFTNDKKAQVIDRLYHKIMEKGDTTAAKIWLTLSGDYVEKSENKNDSTMDLFREINQHLHKKLGD